MFLPQTDSSDDSCWLNEHQCNSPDDILRDVDCSSVFNHSDSSEMLAGDAHEGDGENQEPAHTERTDTGSHIDRSVCLKVGYKLMNRTVFSRLRQVFGCSECEHCGQLFSAQNDLDVHLTVHTAGRVDFHSLLFTQ